MDETFFTYAQQYSPMALLVGVIIYAVRAVFTGQWVPRSTHEEQIKQLREDRDQWRASSEKWEKAAEGQILLILNQQKAVVHVTEHLVKGIREVGTSNELAD